MNTKVDFYVFQTTLENNEKTLIFVSDLKTFQKQVYDKHTMKFTGAMVQINTKESYAEMVESAKKVYFHPSSEDGELLSVENPLKSREEERQAVFMKALHLFLCARASQENMKSGVNPVQAFEEIKKEVLEEISKATYQDVGDLLGDSDLFG